MTEEAGSGAGERLTGERPGRVVPAPMQLYLAEPSVQWDQCDDVSPIRGDPAVKCRQPRSLAAGQCGQVRVGDLTMSMDMTEIKAIETDVVGPERVTLMAGEHGEYLVSLRARPSFADECADEGSLGDGARGKPLVFGRPPPDGGLMVDMVANGQCNENVAVEQVGHASSSAADTISVVTG